MNDVLQLRGTFQQRPGSGRPGSPNIPKKNGASVPSSHLKKLVNELDELAKYWQGQKLITGALIDVNYTRVLAKSNRIAGYFNKGKEPNESIVGARFDKTNVKNPKHKITHYVDNDTILDTIEKVNKGIAIIDAEFNGQVAYDDIANIAKRGIKFENYKLSKSVFLNIVVDSYFVESFSIPNNGANATNKQIVTVYKTDKDTPAIFRSIGITITPGKMLSDDSDNDTTILLRPDEIKLLQSKAPYLIAMAIEDMTKLSLEDIVGTAHGSKAINPQDSPMATIASPTNEPTIGVIDTLFDENVYFSEWVDFQNKLDPARQTSQDDYRHGTAVSSVIVDGHRLNPSLDDGCGHFRVRHFGVAGVNTNSSFTIIKLIQEIVADNRDIKVWNLSLGSMLEINGNSISPEAAILDTIQSENDVVFVIAGTNKPKNHKGEMLIGAPADSINSVVVNAVDKNQKPASYSRKGRVLSFFNKPDVSAFGGDGSDMMRVYEPGGSVYISGTSFATPWIARKMAYLIEVLHLNREVAKALIVDSAAGWENTGNNQDLAPFIGHGSVPLRIEDIVKSEDDEIKFIMTDESKDHDTYAYNIPVPVHRDAYPFITKATLCYFPKCSINQGVDYTDTELDVSIGRIRNNSIKPIDKNMQSVSGHIFYEEDARKLFRKWDNTKHIHERYGDSPRARDAYGNSMWGVSVKRKERLKTKKEPLKFGLVVTLKEVNGINRIHDFKQRTRAAGWIVNEINIDVQVDIYNQLQQPLDFS